MSGDMSLSVLLAFVLAGLVAAIFTQKERHSTELRSLESYCTHLEGEIRRLSVPPPAPERSSLIVSGFSLPPLAVPPPPASLYVSLGQEPPPISRLYTPCLPPKAEGVLELPVSFESEAVADEEPSVHDRPTLPSYNPPNGW